MLAQSPKDVRVALLLNEAEVALGEPATGPTAGDCPAERWVPPAILARLHAGPGGARAPARLAPEARALAETAAGIAPDEPRLLARTALALCQLGAVDRAAALLDRARRSMAPGAPALAWADGRGVAGTWAGGRASGGAAPGRSRGPPAGGAREPGGGRGRRAVGRAGRAAAPRRRAHDVDLAELARPAARNRRTPRRPAATIRCAPTSRACGRASTASSSVAAERLRYALSGHGDACRAAGEYRATLRALKQKPEPSAFAACAPRTPAA